MSNLLQLFTFFLFITLNSSPLDAFTPTSHSASLRTNYNTKLTTLQYRASKDEAVLSVIQRGVVKKITTTKITKMNDSNYKDVLNNPVHPVLLDVYVSNCGPCKLIEQTLLLSMPKYASRVHFAKWNADNREDSTQIMKLMREHNVHLGKMPTLLLFVDGKPVASRSGMATSAQLDTFLMDNFRLLPNDGDENENWQVMSFPWELN